MVLPGSGAAVGASGVACAGPAVSKKPSTSHSDAERGRID
jgi:hypothetical protein